MHPAPSVIVFTTLSGLGFGLLFWLGLGVIVPTGWVAFTFFVIGYLLAVGGLMASTFHMGHPERALKAFTQWRSSWLSREGVSSVAALIVMAVYGAGLVFFDTQWMLVGIIGAVLSAVTVFTTSMIYTQMKTVPRWNTPLTPLLFTAIALAGGALLAGQVEIALILMPVAAAVQVIWWLRGDKAPRFRPQIESMEAIDLLLGGRITVGSSTLIGPSGSRSSACRTIRALWRISSTRTR